MLTAASPRMRAPSRRALAGAALAALAHGTAARPLAAQGAAPADPPAVLTSRDGWIAGAFALGALAVAPFDRPIADAARRPGPQESRALRRAATTFRLASQPGVPIALAVAYGVGRLGGNDRLAEVGVRGGEALAVATVVTSGVKLLAGRSRPYVGHERTHDFAFGRGLRGSDWMSFPSGHTTASFAAASAVTATVAAHSPGARWPLGVALYGAAALAGASRIYDDKHWASDVVGGAAVGTLSGLVVSRYHRARPGGRLDRWLLGASVTAGGAGGEGRRLVPMLVVTRP